MAREPFKHTIAGIIILGVVSGVIANQLGVIDFRKWLGPQAPSNAAPSKQSSNSHEEKPVNRPDPTSTNLVQQGSRNTTQSSHENSFLDPHLMADWKKHKNTAANFSALFPRDPEDKVLVQEDVLQGRMASVFDGGIGYMVVSIWFSDGKLKEEAKFDFVKDFVLKILVSDKCKIGSQGSPTRILSNYNGSSYLIHCTETDRKKEMTVVSNVYLGKHYSYAVMVVYPSIISEPAVAKGFLESFAVIDDTK